MNAIRFGVFALALLVTVVGCGSDPAEEIGGPLTMDDDPSEADTAGDGAEDGEASEEAEEAEAPDEEALAEEEGTTDPNVQSVVREPEGCSLDTGYDGDDQCIQPPAPDEGFQIHYGPRDHSDPAQIEEFLLMPGEEVVDCVYANSSNDERIFFDYFVNRFRPLTHHLTVTRLTSDVEDGHRACGSDGAGSAGLVGGTTVANKSIGAEAVPPENRGLATEVPPHAQMAMQMHFFNFTDEPILREGWMNVYYKDPAEVETVMAPIQGISGLGGVVPPGETGIWQGRMAAPTDLRIVNLYSHFHANTVRMTAWLYPAEGDPFMVYETFDWEHTDVYAYDSVHKNPYSDRETRTPGAHTGMLELQEGDELVWECEIVNELDTPIRWANEAITAEMCIVRGNYAPSWGSPWAASIQ